MNNVAYYSIMKIEQVSKNVENFLFFQVLRCFFNFGNLDSALSETSKNPIKTTKLSTFYEILMRFCVKNKFQICAEK